MPAALYQELNDPGGEIKHMIVVKPDVTMQNPSQVSQPLLCQECEIRFQQHGENWVLSRRYRSDGSFPLRNSLEAATPESANADTRIYDASLVKDVQVDQLTYFAASIYWRAAAANWATKAVSLPRLDFSPQLMTSLTDYLMGHSGFPPEAFLIVSVAEERTPARLVTFPQRDSALQGGERYEFHIPGMMFQLYVNAPDALDFYSLNNSPHRIMLTKLVGKRVKNFSFHLMPTSKPLGSLKTKLT
jgi:hypothetical protein